MGFMMQDLQDKKIVLAVCGGIAAYKAAYLVRDLKKAGAQVQVVMTQAAKEFITPLTLQALSGHPVRSGRFDLAAEQAMGHIELARWADYILIAPATANCLAKCAQGLADDLLSTLYLATTAPVIMCPAMNRYMWEHPATQHHYHVLKARGVLFVGPDAGSQACGEEGYGRLVETQAILNALMLYEVKDILINRRVVITAGPTREALDPVRFLTNKSSGKMGYALAQAARIAGAEVTLISGPTSLPKPLGVDFYAVESAQTMYETVMQQVTPSSIFISCAAVADYRVSQPAAHKIKKQTGDFALSLSLNPDIVAEVAQNKKAGYVIGFAAETEQVANYAAHKLVSKKLDMIIANQVGKEQGFEVDENELLVLTAKEQIALPKASKIRLAAKLIAILAANLQNMTQNSQ